MLIKKTIVLSGVERGKTELLAAEVTKRGGGMSVRIRRGDAVGAANDSVSAFCDLSGGECFIAADMKDDFCLGVFEGGKLAFFGGEGDFKRLKNKLAQDYENRDSAEKKGSFENERYDDFAIAEENYYEKEGENNERGAFVYEKTEDFSRAAPGDEEKKSGESGAYKDEGGDRENRRADGETYYERIKPALRSIFSEFPKVAELERALGGSSFVKIVYAEDKYYVVGLTRDKGKPEYVVFGVPAEGGAEPPAEIEKFAYFVPCEKSGFFLVFRDAFSGDIIPPKK
ncbi:MAG: hypothetical protein J6U35_03100 [Clostridia bacterium]|nr:hypothetical protein [Clostridia bacterium]